MEPHSSSLTTTMKTSRISQSDKHREKCLESSRLRRRQEMELFNEMAKLLPLPNSVSSQLSKASIVRLTNAFLKKKSLLDNSFHDLFGKLNEDKCATTDACWPQALEGMLLALSSDGKIVYITENVVHQLGFAQVDLIGQSIYEFCNPLDHNDLSQEISLRPDGELTRSFSLHLKSTTLKDKKITRKSNQKCASYKVMNCSGHIVTVKSADVRLQKLLEGFFNRENELSESILELFAKSSSSHFLVVICDPIPCPSNVKMSLDSFTTHHSLDMKFTDVDEKICKLLGYSPDDLKNRSVYEFHHPQDSGSIVMSHKTMFNKGQIQIPPYRFLAKHGGFIWIQTKASLVSVRNPNENEEKQVIECLHTCLSEIEEEDQILCINQAEALAELSCLNIQGAILAQYDENGQCLASPQTNT